MLYVQAFGRLWGADGGGKAGRIGRHHHAGDDQGGDGDEDHAGDDDGGDDEDYVGDGRHHYAVLLGHNMHMNISI